MSHDLSTCAYSIFINSTLPAPSFCPFLSSLPPLLIHSVLIILLTVMMSSFIHFLQIKNCHSFYYD